MAKLNDRKNSALLADPWKPTRQLRSCVVYDNAEIMSSATETSKLPTKKEQNAIPVQPFGLFSLLSGWHPARPEKLALRRLTAAAPPLTRKPNGRHTSNRNAVTAQVPLIMPLMVSGLLSSALMQPHAEV